MIAVYFEGRLAEEIGESQINMKINTVKECLCAIHANFCDFQNAFRRAASNYIVVIDGEVSDSFTSFNKKVKESIHFIPILSGAFVIIPAIKLAAVLGVHFSVALLINVAFQALVFLGTTALMAHLADKPGLGTDSESFLFTQGDNVQSQGSVVPVGYGRMKIGSRVISSSLSAMDRNKFDDVISNGLFPPNNEHLSVKESKGGSFSISA